MGTRIAVSQRARDVVRNSFFSGVVTLSNSILGKQKVTMH
jgi:hypothetical protein